MTYRRVGGTGLNLPVISLGLWHNFGHDTPSNTSKAIICRAFDVGITHFDLANNYGPPPGAAEETFGAIVSSDFASHRDEIVVSTKAGYPMWAGPYGDGGSRKSLLASLEQSLKRLKLDYVDIFYSHRFDPNTPLEETMGALDAAAKQGKALYVGVSSYGPRRTAEAATILRALGTPLAIHQPSYSMLNRWIERDGLLDELQRSRVGCIAFSPLAQGMLTSKYLLGIPENSRAKANKSLQPGVLNDATLDRVRNLDAIARRRGQTLAQMAIAWALRDARMTSVLVGASRPDQIDDSVGALANLPFAPEEISEIDKYAIDSDLNLWAESSSA